MSAAAQGALSTLDEQRLAEALALAEQAIGLSEPNPRVGCVVADARGERLARGHTQAVGGPHAEVMALRDAAAQGLDLRGGTAWVSLEPCAHHGRTPPCCDALVAAGLQRVVVAAGDPNPSVNGEGLARLRAAGIEVLQAAGALHTAAREINIGFFSRYERGRPWVRMKMAISLDGRSALADGRSQWITGEAARRDGHAWRRRAGAVLTGIGTVLADDPRLDVRLVPTEVQPLRVLLDRQRRLPGTARILQPPGRLLWVMGGEGAPPQTAAHVEPLLLGVQPEGTDLDLPALLQALAQRQVNELHVEAGAHLNGALLSAGLVDELLLYLAPKLLGPGRPLAELPPLQDLPGASAWQFHSVTPMGADLRLLLRPTA